MHALRKTALVALLAAPAMAQFTYNGCDPLQNSDFKFTELFSRSGAAAVPGSMTLAEPIQMDLHGVRTSSGALDHVDIYFVERLGKVKYFDGAAKEVRDVGTIPVWGKGDNGLMGISIHPDFTNNRWMFLWYCPPISTTGNRRHLELVRYVVTPDHKLDMASKKVIIDILASNVDNWHTGGPMIFDKHGDLWLNIGNNNYDHNKLYVGSHLSRTDSSASSEWGSSNTASMRGGTIRIHPDASAKGYSIPSGNFGEYWAAEWDKQGKTALAKEYRDTAKVLPEVYVKGERSNYSITVHPTKRWLAWGTVNYQSSRDEFNLAGHPIFSGYPYFHADNERTEGQQAVMGFLEDPAAPKNLSPLSTGVKDLPPAIPGTISRLASVAFSGPIYAYDQSLDSKTKFPPHFNNVWLGWDFDKKPPPMWAFSIDSTKLTVAKQTRVDDGLFKGLGLRSPLVMKYGPEGALYILNYDGYYSVGNSGVTRVDYVGNCHLPLTDPTAIIADEKATDGFFAISLSPEALRVGEPGRHEFTLHDVAGHRLLSLSGTQGAVYDLPGLAREHRLRKGLYLVRVSTAKGAFDRKVTL